MPTQEPPQSAPSSRALPRDPAQLSELVGKLTTRWFGDDVSPERLRRARHELLALRQHYRVAPEAFSRDLIEALRLLAKRLEAAESLPRPSALEVLKRDFGYTSFRPGQQPVIEAVLNGRDCLAVLPTGAGKSLCYQLPARVLGGLTLVISPLIALMKDQVDSLNESGIAATFLNSSLSPEARQTRVSELLAGKYELLYAAPEGLEASVGALLGRLPISLVAVDEAHCISHWGHDFRPSYRQLKGLKARFRKAPILALTATATPQVAEDIVTELSMASPLVHRGSFFRKNLRLSAYQKGQSLGMSTKEAVGKLVMARPGQSGIVYCLSRKNTETTAEYLRDRGVHAAAYHAGLAPEERERVQNGYRDDDLDVVVATIAFGMGIDKSNVRYVIHQDMPRSLEGYMQEIGRAGRDGLDSDCILFYSWSDVLAYERISEDMEDEYAKERLRTQSREMFRYASDSGCRHQRLVEHFDESIGSCGTACDDCDSLDLLSEASRKPHLRKGARHVPRKKASDSPVPPEVAPLESVESEELSYRFERLKALRSALAKQRSVPAYVIFNDSTLLAMAQANPGTLEELAQIPGVGAKKLESYGAQFLALILALVDE
ncbi:MAG: ATP-dependent DNA helicase RecQ [Polyangiaceae bacterium]